MMPIICKIGPFTIFSYGLMLAIAFMLSSLLACRRAKGEGFNPEDVLNFCFLVFFSGVVGSRLFFVVENLALYLRDPLQIIMLQHGGMSWFGGLLLGSLAGLAYIRKKNIPALKLLDFIIPYVALGQAIGRLGCFLNGCCYGKASRLGIYFPSLGKRIPTQIYSFLLLLVIFVVLMKMQKKKYPAGTVFCAYLLLYPAKRFFIEFWRADNPQLVAGLTLFQLLSIAMFIFGVCLFSILNKKRK